VGEYSISVAACCLLVPVRVPQSAIRCNSLSRHTSLANREATKALTSVPINVPNIPRKFEAIILLIHFVKINDYCILQESIVTRESSHKLRNILKQGAVNCKINRCVIEYLRLKMDLNTF